MTAHLDLRNNPPPPSTLVIVIFDHALTQASVLSQILAALDAIVMQTS